MVLILLSVAVLMLPGLLVARAAGLAGWTSLGAAPLVSYGIAATAGPITSFLGIAWRPWTMLAATGALAGACWAMRSWLRRGPAGSAAGGRTPPKPAADRCADRIVAAGVLAGAVLGAVAIMRGIGGLDAVHQGWDAGFHANAIRFISDTGNAAPGALSAINNYEDDAFFYPNAQHVLTSIVGQLGGGSPVQSLLNAQMLLLPGIAGLGLAVLVRAFRGRVALAASVPLVLVSFNGFPYDLLSRGPLLPYATGVALVPAFMALLGEALARRTTPIVALTAIGAAGLLAVHPSTALTAAIFTIPLLVHRWRAGRPVARTAEALTLLKVGVVSAIVGLPFVLGAVAVGEARAVVDWPAFETAGQALGHLLLLEHGGGGPQLWLVALLAVGVAHVGGIRQLWWWLAGAGVFGCLFVAVSSTDSPLSEALTQPWWNDRWRFLALVSLGLAMVAAHGAVVVGESLAGAVRRLLGDRAMTPRTALGGAMVAVLAGFGVISNSFYVPDNEQRVSANYQGGPTVTSSEQSAMRALAEMAGSTGRVMNDPGDGSAWMYALEGVRPIFGHVIDPATFGSIGRDQQLLLSSFHCVDSSPAVRELVQKYDIDYVFTGEGYLRDDFSRIPGLEDLRMVDSLELVYAGAGSAIYRVRLAPLADESATALACTRAEPDQPVRIAWI